MAELVCIVMPLVAELPANPYAAVRAYVPGSRRRRVLLIAHTCQSRTEGQEKAHALAALPDVELHLLVPQRWKHYGQWRAAQPPINPAFKCTIAPVRFPWLGPAQCFLHHYPQLPQILRTFQPDIIDLWEEPWGYVSAHACKWRNRLLPDCQIVSETEQNILKELPPPFENFRRFTLQNANYVVARNRQAIDVVRTNGYQGPAQVVPNAVDTRIFRPLDRAACRQKCMAALGHATAIDRQKALDEFTFLAGYVGRLVPEKGLLTLLDALPLAPPAVHVLFVGSGSLEPLLRRRAVEMSLAARVHFLPERPLEQLPELMNALEVLVLPSLTTPRWKEQFGRVIIEAHACATPVIGSDSGAIPDVIADAGLVVPENNPQQLATALATLAANRALGRTLGENGLRNAREHFTWQRVAQRMATIYQIVDPRA